MDDLSFGELDSQAQSSARLKLVALVVAAAGVGLLFVKRHGSAATPRSASPQSSRFTRLRRELLDRTKKQVLRSLGPPPTAMGDTAKPTIWDAQTWYYPFDVAEQSAIAIGFERNRVRKIEFIGNVEGR